MAPLHAKQSETLVPADSEGDSQESLSRHEVTMDTIAADSDRLHSLYRGTVSPSDANLPSKFNTLPDYRTAGHTSGSYGQGGPSLTARQDDGVNGSGISKTQITFMAIGAAGLAATGGLFGYTKYANVRDRRKAALSQSQLEQAQEPTESNSRAPPELNSRKPPAPSGLQESTEPDSGAPSKPAPTASYCQAPTELDQDMTDGLLDEVGSGTDRRSFPKEWRLSEGQQPIELDDMAPERPKRVYQQIK